MRKQRTLCIYGVSVGSRVPLDVYRVIISTSRKGITQETYLIYDSPRVTSGPSASNIPLHTIIHAESRELICRTAPIIGVKTSITPPWVSAVRCRFILYSRLESYCM